MPRVLRHGWSLLRAPANEIGFAVRAALRWQRGRPTPSAAPRGQPFDQADPMLRPALLARVAELLRHHELAPLCAASTSDVYCRNLARLEALQRLAVRLELPVGPAGCVRATDIGCGDFHYATALQQWLSRHGTAVPRRVELRGIELDGYGIYRDGHSRADHARRQAELASLGGSTVRFEVADANRIELPEQDVVSLFFPFLTTYACLSWGTPLSRLRPRRMLRRAVQALRPGGWLVVANQTVDEHLRLCRLLAGLPIVRIARRRLATDLSPESSLTQDQVGSIWLRRQRQEDVPSGKSSW